MPNPACGRDHSYAHAGGVATSMSVYGHIGVQKPEPPTVIETPSLVVDRVDRDNLDRGVIVITPEDLQGWRPTTSVPQPPPQFDTQPNRE